MNAIYTIETASALLQCHPDTLRKLCRLGQLKSYQKLRKWYILHEDLLDYIKH